MPLLINQRLAAQIERRTSNLFYGDRALLLIDVDTGTVDDLNNPIVTTNEVPIDCSYTELTPSEQWRNYGDVGIVDGEIRFNGPTPTKGNRFKIISRFDGIPLPGNEMEIISINDRNSLGFLCALKAVSL